LKAQYTIKLNYNQSQDVRMKLEDCMLSPRSHYMDYDDGRRKSGYPICKSCKNYVRGNQLPLFCIANNYAIGKTPNVIATLTQIELAMLSPVRTYGYCFSYTGGKHRQIKGSLSYYKISTETLVQTGIELELLQLNNHVVVMLYGSFTAEQKSIVTNRYEIRTEKIIKAIGWLVKNNTQWHPYRKQFQELKSRNFENLTSIIHEPRFYDNSVPAFELETGVQNETRVQSEEDLQSQRRAELSESFQVYYPDGTVSTLTGGQQNLQDFQRVVKEATEMGYKIECRMSVITAAVDDYKEKNLVNACLLQFPYGRGGLDEERQTSQNCTSEIVDIFQYTQYVSLLSLPQFQAELFCLQLYNMQMKFKMVNTAGYRVRSKLYASILSEQISPTDVYDAIDHTRGGRIFESESVTRGQVLLGAVDAICKYIPHTNEAANRARRDMETMQHHFGSPTYFLTVTPDDDNHILVQIYSEEILSSVGATDTMNDEQVFELSQQKNALRIKNPGVCAFFLKL
jgi:hypothetical protein